MSQILAVLAAAGVPLKPTGNGNYLGRCFAHEDVRPSMSVSATLNSYNCFGCGASGGYLKAAELLNVDLDAVLPLDRTPASVRQVAQARPMPAPRAVPAPVLAEAVRAELVSLPTCPQDSATADYIERRGLTRATGLGMRFTTPASPLVKWGERTVPAWSLGFRWGALLLDVDGSVSGAQFRRIDDSELKFYTLGSGAFGTRARTAKARRVILAEGLGDFFQLAAGYDAPGVPVIGIPGAARARALLEPCEFRPGAEVVIAFDHDPAGDKAAAEVAELVARHGAIPLRAAPEVTL